MKIVDLKTRVVAIPLNAQLRHNTGVHPGYFLRTILELVTDEGIVGLGEVGGGDQRGALAKLKPRVLGLDPFHLNVIKQKVLRSIYYLSNARLYAAIEMACLDIQGKVLNRPVFAIEFRSSPISSGDTTGPAAGTTKRPKTWPTSASNCTTRWA
jgi:glucarate dehydratase